MNDRTLPLPLACTTALAVAFGLFQPMAGAQNSSDPRALEIVRAAVAAQMADDRNDRSNWIYTDHDVTPDHDTVSECVGSPNGELRREVIKNGQPVSADFAQKEINRINSFVADTDAQAKAKKSQAHDDAQATELMQQMPVAFLWTIAAENAEETTLNYRPNPNFSGPDMASRVMASMSGQMVVTRRGNIIKTLRGELTEEFRIGFGLLGHLNKGGNIDVERRDVGGGHWEIAETHVHMGGKALFFKSIGTQEDEVKTNWKPSPAKDLTQAAQILENGRGTGLLAQNR